MPLLSSSPRDAVARVVGSGYPRGAVSIGRGSQVPRLARGRHLRLAADRLGRGVRQHGAERVDGRRLPAGARPRPRAGYFPSLIVTFAPGPRRLRGVGFCLTTSPLCFLAAFTLLTLPTVQPAWRSAAL